MKKTAFLIGLAAALGFSGTAQAIDWDWKGDVRYRLQQDAYYQGKDKNNEFRQRIRVRFGFQTWINEELTAGVRLATGKTSDPVSRNQTLDGGFGAKNILLDEAWFSYHPMFLNGDVNLLLGKRATKYTFNRVHDLIWDSDVTIEGATLQYGKDANGKQKDGLGVVAGYYPVGKNLTGRYNVGLVAGQLSYKGAMSDVGFNVVASYYDWINVAGGTATTFSDFDSRSLGRDFNIVELAAALDGKVSSLPWKLYGQWAKNTASKNDTNFNLDDHERAAFLAGLKLGKAKHPGQMEGSLEYYHIEQDAVTAYTDSDRKVSMPTGVQGIKLTGKYQLIQNMFIGGTWFNDKDISTGNDRKKNTFMFDTVVKF